MSFQSLADAFTYVQRREDITSNEVLVLLALANHKNSDQPVAYPSIASLQRTTKLSRRAVQYALRGLEEKKAVETILDVSGHKASSYRLLIPHVYCNPSTVSTKVNGSIFPRAPGAPPRAPRAPQPVREPEEKKKEENDRKDLKEQLLRLEVAPGSHIWNRAVN